MHPHPHQHHDPRLQGLAQAHQRATQATYNAWVKRIQGTQGPLRPC